MASPNFNTPPDQASPRFGHISFFATKAFLEIWQTAMRETPETATVPFVEHFTADPLADREQLMRTYPKAWPIARCGTLNGLIPMIRIGISIGRMPRFMSQQRPELVEVMRCDDVWNRTLWVLTHPDLRRTRWIGLFMEYVRDRFAERRDYF